MIPSTSRRLPRLPVMQTLEPPSIIRFVEVGLQWIVMDDLRSMWTPQTHGEQTMCITLSVMDGGCGRVARKESEICSAQRSMARVVSKGDRVSSLRRQPGGHGLCNIGGATNGGGSGAGGTVGGANASKRSLFATAQRRISKLVAVSVTVLATQNRFLFWRPCGWKQFSVLAWQA